MFCGVTVVLLFVFLLTICVYVKRSFFVRNDRINHISGPKPEWVFGNLRKTGITSGRRLFHEVFADLKQQYGDVFSFWIGPTCGLALSRLEHVQQVLADRQTYDQADLTINSLSLIFPAGLISLRGNAWKRHARFILPMFRRTKITPYLSTIVDCVDHFIDDHFNQNNSKIHTDLVQKSQQLLLNIIGHIAFDYDLGQASSTDADLRKALKDLIRSVDVLFILGALPRWLGKLFLMMYWRFQRTKRIIKHYVMQIIVEEKNRQENLNLSKKPKSLIASLVAAIHQESSSFTETSLTPNEVFDEISMLILAGFETTSTALSWFIFYMTKHPAIQQKIKTELSEHHLTFNNPLTQETLDSLIYVDCVIKEVLRFAPITAFFARQATRDDWIDDIPVKRGDHIFIISPNLHRDQRYWKVDPSKFVPERFLDQDKTPPHGAYLPFGGGHRACPGQELAIFDLKIAITRLMQRVTFEDPGKEADNSGGFMQRITCLPKHLAVRVHMDSVKASIN